MSAETPSRRQILKAAAAGAAASAFGPFFPGRVLGANDRVNMAIIGVRGQGRGHIGGFGAIAGVHLKTLCDIDENVSAQRAAEVEKTQKVRPGTEWDMRRVFDDKEIDAVSFATPNHWHALGTIWACQAKKHVYVEKPACHTYYEGRQMVNAARKHNVLVQVGFQNRSRPTTVAAIKLLHEGKLGKIFMVRGLCYKPRQNIGRFPDGPMADGAKLPPMVGGDQPPYTKAYLDKVHYDLWMGPAPARPFNPNRFHYNWHWQWDYGGGDTANQGPHQFDVGRWGLNKDELPVRVRSSGGLYLWTDTDQNTPNTQTTIMEYADGTVFEFATRGLPTNAEGMLPRKEGSGVQIGNIFYGSEGRLEIDADGNWKTFMGSKGEPGADSTKIAAEKADATRTVGSGMGDHFRNFVEAVKAGSRDKLTCDVEVGVKSSALPIFANISYRLKRELMFDAKKDQFARDGEANRMLHRNDRKGFAVPRIA